jgi:sigma-B regulation protein RsbU (phosphoserine phosphatase)
MPASSASSAASNSHLERRLAGLERLLEVTRVLAAEVDLKRILATIAGAACRAIDCERASIFQYDPKTRELYTSVATELEIQEIRKGIDSGISGYVARERRMLNVADPQSDSRWDSTVDLVTGFRTRSILAAPLVSSHDDSLLGVVQLLNNRGGPFDRTDEELLAAFSQHAAVALDRARLVEEIRRRQEVEVSLQVAREIQRGFMPENMPSIPGYQAASWWFPNQAVGGDYCDIVPMRDGRYCLCVADVSGHGLGPSLLMASVRAALRALLLDHASPRVLMELLGQAMSGDLRQGRFITIVVGLLDPRAPRRYTIRPPAARAARSNRPACRWGWSRERRTRRARP